MTKNHLKRLAVPKTWPTKRKGVKFISKPQAGKEQRMALSLVVVARDLIGIVGTAKELQVMCHNGHVVVDGKVRKSIRYPVGVFDVITFTKSKQSFRLILNSVGKLQTVPAKDDSVIGRVIGKKQSKKGTQINLHNGRNIIVAKDEVKVGDSLLIQKDKIKEVLPLAKGATVMLTSGKHIGSVGHVEDIQGKIILFKDGDDVFETSKKYA